MNQKSEYNPWMDVRAYELSDAKKFKGREDDIDKFLKIMENGTMSVLYANSGIGKTSFINAGIEPILIEQGYYPIHILFPDDVYEGTDVHVWLFDQICNKIESFPLPEYSDIKFDKNIWWLLHATEIKDPRTHQTVKPLIVFDQFEEVFKKSVKIGNKFFLQSLIKLIEDLSSSSIPQEIENKLYDLEKDGMFIQVDTRPNYKVLFSIRKEYLADFDDWTNDKFTIPDLCQNRMFLLAMTREQAKKVITEQPTLDGKECITMLSGCEQEILNLIDSKHKNVIEPFILSVLCSKLYEQAVSEGVTLYDEKKLPDNVENIIRDFYEDKINGIFKKSNHRYLFEQSLVDEDGDRRRPKIKELKDFDFQEKYQDQLVNAHIIRVDESDNYVELIHDKIAVAAYASITARKTKRKHFVQRFVIILCVIAMFCATLYFGIHQDGYGKNPLYEIKGYTIYSSDSNFILRKNNQNKDVIFDIARRDLLNDHLVETIIIDDSCSIFSIENCWALKQLKVTKNVETLELIICRCPSLESLELPNSIRYLQYTIRECPRLTVPIPESVKNIEIHSSDLLTIVNHSPNLSWEECRIKDVSLGYALWDKNQKKIKYLQYSVSEDFQFPMFSRDLDSTIYQNRQFKNINRNGKDTVSVEITDSIGKGTYANSLKIKRLNFSAKSTKIASYAFYQSAGLDTIIFPHSLTKIGDNAFEKCPNLRYVEFLSDKISLGSRAFGNCPNLQTVVLPDDVDYEPDVQRSNTCGIDFIYNPFFNCPNLKSFIIRDAYKSKLRIKDSTVVKKNNGEPLFMTASYNTYNEGDYFSENGILYHKKDKAMKIISIPSTVNMSKIIKAFGADGNVITKDFLFAYSFVDVAINILGIVNEKSCDHLIVNNPTAKELFFPIVLPKTSWRFVYPIDSLRSIHVPYPQPDSTGQTKSMYLPDKFRDLLIEADRELKKTYSNEFRINIPDSLKQRITLHVPHRCSKYYINHPDFVTFKAIVEEPMWKTYANLLYIYWDSMCKYFPSISWDKIWPITVLILSLIYFFRNRIVTYAKKYGWRLGIYLGALLVLYTISYWFITITFDLFYGGWGVKHIHGLPVSVNILIANLVAIPISFVLFLLFFFSRENGSKR